MRKLRQIRRAFSLALPEDALASGARVTMIARSSVLVEGQRGVIELARSRIRLRTKKGVVSVCGGALRLEELSLDAAMISGDPITAVTYGRPPDGEESGGEA